MHFRDWSVRSQRCTCLRDEESEKTGSQGGGFESFHFLSLKKKQQSGAKGSLDHGEKQAHSNPRKEQINSQTAFPNSGQSFLWVSWKSLICPLCSLLSTATHSGPLLSPLSGSFWRLLKKTYTNAAGYHSKPIGDPGQFCLRFIA